MIVEQKTDPSHQTPEPAWAPAAPRRGERSGWIDKRQAPIRSKAKTGDEELIHAPLTPPPIWPRVFPGI